MSDSWIDQSKLAAALAMQQPGADGRNILTGQGLLSALNPIAAPRWVPARQQTVSGGDGADPITTNEGGYFVSSNGTILNSPDGGKTFTDKYDNPTGNGNRDQAHVTYQLSADGKTAIPISANNQYQPGEWVSNGRDVATTLGAVLAGGFGGAALAGAGGGGAAAGAGGGAGAAGAGAGASTGLGALGTGVGYTVPSGYTGLMGLSTAELNAIAAGASAGAAGAGGAGAAAAAAPGAGTTAGAAGATTAAGGVASGGLGTAGAGTAAAGAASSLIPGVSNGQAISTAGGLLGAAVGASKAGGSLNSATTTNQNTVDPRVAQYVYGPNGNGGLLGNVNSLMNSQLATGGLNATQTQGLNMQLSALQDPAYGASLQQMRNVGSGLLGGTQAANPFNGGAMGAPSAQGAPAPAQAMPPGWQPMQTQLNQQQRMPPAMGLLQQPNTQMENMRNPPRPMAY